MNLVADYSFSKPVPDADLVVLSLGAGVQSSTLALMAARRDIGPMPDYAIFADTGWEPEAVYEWLDWLETQLPFPVLRVQKGNIKEDMLVSRSQNKRVGSMPLFTEGDGRIMRSCTKEYKIEPIIAEVRRLIGLEPRKRKTDKKVEQWIGISTDEFVRMKVSGLNYIEHRWPLIEAGMDRAACKKWMLERQYPLPPKSACIGCPFHNNEYWRTMKEGDPVSWSEAVEFDDKIRSGLRGTKRKLYLHNQRVPLADVDFRSSSDKGQLSFLDECDGMCGL